MQLCTVNKLKQPVAPRSPTPYKEGAHAIRSGWSRVPECKGDLNADWMKATWVRGWRSKPLKGSSILKPEAAGFPVSFYL